MNRKDGRKENIRATGSNRDNGSGDDPGGEGRSELFRSLFSSSKRGCHQVERLHVRRVTIDGKMAVRGTKGTTPTTQPNDQGYYNMDGAFVPGEPLIIVRTYLTETDKIYHFDIGYYNLQSLVDPAVLVLLDENDKVLTAIPWAEGGFLNKYLVFTSAVKKYGVTCILSPIVNPYPPIINETYEIEDINDVLSNMNAEIKTNTASIFAVEGNINTSAITVTVHADVYAKIQDETQTEWHALITSAQEKQITFATA